MLEEFVSRIFDYAGMFPPESKSFDDALAASCRFGQELRRPQLVNADFVAPLKDLKLLTPERLIEAGRSVKDRRYRVALLGSSLEDLKSDRKGAAALPHLDLLSYEYKIPGRPAIDPLKAAADGIRETGALLCLEPDLSGSDWQSVLGNLCEHISATGNPRLTVKIRCGGQGALDAAKVARAIDIVAGAQVSLKATAGLHHPVIETERYGNALGFLSFKSALAFRRKYSAQELPEEAVLRCLTSTNAADFIFDSDFGLRWDKYSLSAAEYALQRTRFSFSIGSCSLHEPDADLQRLYGPGV